MPTMEFPHPSAIFLRKVSMFLIIPAAPLLITAGVYGTTSLTVGLVPHAISIILGILALCKPKIKLNVAAIIPDIALGVLYLLCCAPLWQWADGRRNWGDNPSDIMMKTYASTFLILEMAIHVCLALYTLCAICPAIPNFFHGLTSGLLALRECSHCHEQRTTEEGRVALADSPKSIDNGPQYSLLGGDEQTNLAPRLSEDTL